MAADQIYPIIRVSAPELRRIFNAEQFHEKTKTGALRDLLMKEKHPSPQPAREPFCTRSQVISYKDSKGTEVARVHQYLRPDGTVGGSGKPDPKRLLYQGTIYLVG
jgi:hypothetical protein